MKSSRILLCAVLCILFLSSCAGNKKIETISKSDFLLDTFITVTIYDKREDAILEGVFDVCRGYEQLLSKTIETSEIYRINHSNNEFIEVSKDTLELIEKSIYYGELSDGIFDITIGGVVDLWHFIDEIKTVPGQADIEERLKAVDYAQIEVADNKVRLKNKGAMLDLGAIAKGYIADKMSEYLKEQGVNSAIISLGGNILTVGEKTNKKQWMVAIQKPFGENAEVIANLLVDEKSVVTSGVYERFFYEDSILYHHILDTKTGYPMNNNIMSVTILSDKSVDGDALSTVTFGLGVERGIALIESMDNVEVIFVTDKNEIYASSGIGEDIPFEVTDKDYSINRPLG